MQRTAKSNKKMTAIKYALALGLLVLVAYNSVYFKKLDEMKRSAVEKFDAASYAQNFLTKTLRPALPNATDLNSLVKQLATAKDKTFDKYSHAAAIGNIKYFLVKTTGTVTAINENNFLIKTATDSAGPAVSVATEFVYGNAIRDASGLFDIKPFTNTMDINNISAEINKLIRTTVIPAVKKQLQKGDVVNVTGAIEMNRQHLTLNTIEIMPIEIHIIK